MDLNLDLNLFEPTSALTAERGRDLTDADRAMLGVGHTTASPLKRLRERHHSLAKLLAAGVKPGVAGVSLGYSPSRVSILQADATFQELVVFYTEHTDAIYVGIHEQLAGMTKDAAEELRRRLEDAPEELSVGALTELIKLGADRVGHGPTSTQNHNHNINIADRLEAARKRVKTIEHEGVEHG